MNILLYILMFLASVVVTLGGCALFTNAIEWLGKRLKVPEGAVNVPEEMLTVVVVTSPLEPLKVPPLTVKPPLNVWVLVEAW